MTSFYDRSAFILLIISSWASLVAQMEKNLLARQKTRDQSRGLGKSPGEVNGYPLQYSCLENPMDRGAWWATVHGVAESDMTEQLTLTFSTSSRPLICNLINIVVHFGFSLSHKIIGASFVPSTRNRIFTVPRIGKDPGTSIL